jgi:hypothetical protein
MKIKINYRVIKLTFWYPTLQHNILQPLLGQPSTMESKTTVDSKNLVESLAGLLACELGSVSL